MGCVLDKMMDLVIRETATLVSKLVDGQFDNGVRVLQDWLSIRLGCVCAVLQAGQDGLFCRCGDLPPRAVADRESGPKAPEIA